MNSISRITFAGAPAAITPAGRSRVTTEFAPTTVRSPIVTPPVTTQFVPNQQLSPIFTGPLGVIPCHVMGMSGSSKRWSASVRKQWLANMQCSPIVDAVRRGDHAPEVHDRPVADPHGRRLGIQREPAAALDQHPGADVGAALVERLQQVAVHREPQVRVAAQEVPLHAQPCASGARCARTRAASAVEPDLLVERKAHCVRRETAVSARNS